MMPPNIIGWQSAEDLIDRRGMPGSLNNVGSHHVCSHFLVQEITRHVRAKLLLWPLQLRVR